MCGSASSATWPATSSGGRGFLAARRFSIFAGLGLNSGILLLTAVVMVVGIGAPLVLGPCKSRWRRCDFASGGAHLLQAARVNMAAAWKLATVQVLATLVIFGSLLFYLLQAQAWSLPLVVVTGAIAWTWLGMMIYMASLMLRANKSLRLGLRNSAVAVLRYPFFTATLIVLCAAVTLLSCVVVPLMALVTISLLVVVGVRATNWVLVQEGVLPDPSKVELEEGNTV
ncbi:MAG: hypothetical protein WKH64_03445 [Chloroflexia bacterium]